MRKAIKARIAVFVSGGGSNLQALIDQSGKTLKSGVITLVVADRPCSARERARNAGIPFAEIQRGPDFEEKALAILQERKIDLVILAGFLSILSAEFVSVYKDRIINIHPSLIPAFAGPGYYGLRVHRAALKRGVQITGATVHIVNEIPDGGPIILQKAVVVRKHDTPETLQLRVLKEAEWVILPKAAEMVSKAIVKGEPTWK